MSVACCHAMSREPVHCLLNLLPSYAYNIKSRVTSRDNCSFYCGAFQRPDPKLQTLQLIVNQENRRYSSCEVVNEKARADRSAQRINGQRRLSRRCRSWPRS